MQSQTTTKASIRRAARRTWIAFEKLKSSACFWRDLVLGLVLGVATNIVGYYAMRKGWLPADARLPIQAVSGGVAFLVSFPLLRDLALTILRAVVLIGNAALVAIGVAVATILVYQPLSDVFFQDMPSVSRQLVMTATLSVAMFGAVFGLARWAAAPNRVPIAHPYPSFSAGEWNVARAARHEAGHGLVAIVLGLPVQDVHVKVAPDALGIGGFLRIEDNKQPMTDIDAVLSHLLRRIAVEVAGVLAEENWPSARAACRRLGTQQDHAQACGHMFSVALIRPAHPEAGNHILDATWKDITPAAWINAIQELTDILVRDGVVPADTVREIAQRFDLTMPCVEAVIDHVINDAPRSV
jgi:hypothetical protein